MTKAETFGELDHPARLLMGPGPVNVHPRVLRAMSVQLLGQFDPEFTAYMNETMALYRQVFVTENRWTFLIDGTSRAYSAVALAGTASNARSVCQPTPRITTARSKPAAMIDASDSSRSTRRSRIASSIS